MGCKRIWPPGTSHSKQEFRSCNSSGDPGNSGVRNATSPFCNSRTHSELLKKHLLVFLAPAVLIYTVFMICPLVDSLWLSLSQQRAGGGTSIYRR